MSNEQVAELLKGIVNACNIKVNEFMKYHTSFKVGGPADVLVIPENIEQLAGVVKICKQKEIPLFILGNGTNLIVRDKGIRGVVVKISNNLSKYCIDGDLIEAEAGVLLSEIANVAMEHELAGLEFASGIPGTLGGAVIMNAGAYGPEMKDVVIKTHYIDAYGVVKALEGEQHGFGYRTSAIQREGGIVLKAVLKLSKGNRLKIKELMDDLNNRRRNSQPLEMPSAGSIFKRPEGYFTGKLIQDCGLKGFAIGGAQISDKHCGFIVNRGDATAEEIIHLIEFIKKQVKDKLNVQLNTEVKIVGDE